jgi:N utilization substance protein B
MTSRREARRQAIDVLYQADVTGRDPRSTLLEWRAAGRAIDAFAEELVEGVGANQDEIDRLLSEHAEHWTVDRMASLDRTILRVACYEIRYRTDIPVGAAISEAVLTAKELSTEDSGRFVNGILGQIAGSERSREPPSDGS